MGRQDLEMSRSQLLSNLAVHCCVGRSKGGKPRRESKLVWVSRAMRMTRRYVPKERATLLEAVSGGFERSEVEEC